jgi:hypothetical protein
MLADRSLAQMQDGGGAQESAVVSDRDEAPQRRHVQDPIHVNHRDY